MADQGRILTDTQRALLDVSLGQITQLKEEYATLNGFDDKAENLAKRAKCIIVVNALLNPAKEEKECDFCTMPPKELPGDIQFFEG
jgi:hypothetical protein